MIDLIDRGVAIGPDCFNTAREVRVETEGRRVFSERVKVISLHYLAENKQKSCNAGDSERPPGCVAEDARRMPRYERSL
jgi:hypothetical protein